MMGNLIIFDINHEDAKKLLLQLKNSGTYYEEAQVEGAIKSIESMLTIFRQILMGTLEQRILKTPST